MERSLWKERCDDRTYIVADPLPPYVGVQVVMSVTRGIYNQSIIGLNDPFDKILICNRKECVADDSERLIQMQCNVSMG
jgi:hypothetical protein